MKLRAKAAVQSAILLVVSLVIALGLSEGMARVYVWLNNSEIAAPQSSTDDAGLSKKYFNIVLPSGARRLEEPLAERYLSQIPLANGVDPKWFKELPFAPDRDPKDVDPHDAALLTEYLKHGHFGPESAYVWNAKFV